MNRIIVYDRRNTSSFKTHKFDVTDENISKMPELFNFEKSAKLITLDFHNVMDAEDYDDSTMPGSVITKLKSVEQKGLTPIIVSWVGSKDEDDNHHLKGFRDTFVETGLLNGYVLIVWQTTMKNLNQHIKQKITQVLGAKAHADDKYEHLDRLENETDKVDFKRYAYGERLVRKIGEPSRNRKNRDFKDFYDRFKKNEIKLVLVWKDLLEDLSSLK